MSTAGNKFKLTMQSKLKKIKSRSNLDKLAKEAIKTIVKRTQEDGQGVRNFGGNKRPLKKLAPATIKTRKNFKGLSGKTTPSTSNLTMTGQLLDSLTYTIKGITGIVFKISGGRNKRVAEHVQSVRPFFTLSKTELNKLAQFFKNLTKRK